MVVMFEPMPRADDGSVTVAQQLMESADIYRHGAADLREGYRAALGRHPLQFSPAPTIHEPAARCAHRVSHPREVGLPLCENVASDRLVKDRITNTDLFSCREDGIEERAILGRDPADPDSRQPVGPWRGTRCSPPVG